MGSFAGGRLKSRNKHQMPGKVTGSASVPRAVGVGGVGNEEGAEPK